MRKHLCILQRTWQAHQLSFRWEKEKWFWGLLGLRRAILLINIHSSREWKLISRITFHEWQIHLSDCCEVHKMFGAVYRNMVILFLQTGNTIAKQQFRGLPMREIQFAFFWLLIIPTFALSQPPSFYNSICNQSVIRYSLINGVPLFKFWFIFHVWMVLPEVTGELKQQIVKCVTLSLLYLYLDSFSTARCAGWMEMAA